MMRRLTALPALAALALLFAPGAAVAQVDVNTATKAELARLPGIGDAIAQRIIDARTESGPFAALDDLTRIEGIGPATVEKLQGMAVAGSAAQSTYGETVDHDAQVQAILDQYRDEPTIQAVQASAMRYAEVHPELIASWRSRAGLQALLPELRGEYRRNLEDDQRQTTEAGQPPREQQDIDNDNRYTFRARWNLNELIFNTDELRVSSEAVRLVKLREDVLTQVTKLYYERRRLQVERDLAPAKNTGAAMRREMRLRELTAQVDALTGGWFSAELSRVAGR